MTLHQDKSYHISALLRPARQATNCLFYKSTFLWKTIPTNPFHSPKICIANYTKRDPDKYRCSSFHSLIFHWFCYSLLLFKASTTEPNSIGNFGLLRNIFSEKKGESHSEHTQGLLGNKDNPQIIFFYCFQWCNTGILEAYFLRLCSVLSEAGTFEYSILN